jgi:hypothetical protein
MIVDHTNRLYSNKRRKLDVNKYNGAYYYSKDIVKNIIPELIDKTDRNWITVRLPEAGKAHNHSIVFIHNNRNPNYYVYLKQYEDVIAVCSQPETAENMKFYADHVIYLPLSVDVKQIEKYKTKVKDKFVAFAGRPCKITNQVPSFADRLTNLPRYKLLREISRYYSLYAVGRTAIEGKILGCKILAYDPLYPNPDFWKVLDNHDAAKMLLEKINEI